MTLSLLVVLISGLLPASFSVYAAPVAQGVQRISFAPGATSATVNGGVNPGAVTRYVLTAMAGQTMSVQPYTNGAPVYVSVYDPSRALMGTVASGQTWSGRLPTTGDYTLAVSPSSHTRYTSFQLRVSVVSGSQPTPPAPERIYFAPGAVSTQVTGYLPSSSSKSYVLNARAGQVMTINSWTGSGPFRFTVSAPNSATLGSGNQGQSWSGILPSSGDYLITLQTPTDVPPVNYGLTITIVNASPTPVPTPVPPPAQRISFPAGATSVSVSGTVNPTTSVRYVLRALQGQTMYISLGTYNGNPVTITIRDPRGNVLGSTVNSQPWSGRLPSTGDYTIDVQAAPGSPGDQFSLYIQIT